MAIEKGMEILFMPFFIRIGNTGVRIMRTVLPSQIASPGIRVCIS
jgi:hypothetical protein